MTTPLTRHQRGWRDGLAALAASARSDLLIASPYIKAPEAQWLCERVRPAIHLRVLTSVTVDSISSQSLDIEALSIFVRAGAGSEVVTLPRLHAKVFIADTTAAIVTSANMTTAGINTNYEYGLGVRDHAVVTQIRRDLEAYARLGSPLDTLTLDGLAGTASALIEEAERLQRAAPRGLRAAFNARLRAAREHLTALQVGDRTANQVFGEAIHLALANGPMTTAALAPEVQRLLGDMCDDNVELIINGERYGKVWKHQLRNAQQHLKRRGEITYDSVTRRWALTS